MTKLSWFFTLSVSILATSLTRAESKEISTLAGVWEQRYQDAVGQHYLDVLELHADGTYTTHMQGIAPDDRGSYTLDNGIISFLSEVDPQLSQQIPYSLQKEQILSLTLPGLLGPTIVNWQRSSLTRTLDIVNIDGVRTPTQLPLLVSFLTADARQWQADALPTEVHVELLQNGEYLTRVHFFSPLVNRQFRIMVNAFDVKTSSHDGSRSVSTPLSPDFLDLPVILEFARNNDQLGTLTKANIQMWGDYGAVWRTTMSTNQMASFSALTGERINADVSGYIANYEAGWNRASELWDLARRRYAQAYGSNSDEDEDDFWDDYDGSYQQCSNLGGSWETKPGFPQGGECH